MKHLKLIKLLGLFFLVTLGNSAFAMTTVGLDFTIVNTAPETQTVEVKGNPFSTILYKPDTNQQGPEPYAKHITSIGANDPSWIETGFDNPTLEDLKKGVPVHSNASVTLGRVEYAYYTQGTKSYRTSVAFLVKGLNGAKDRECKLNFHVWIPGHAKELMVHTYENNGVDSALRYKAPESAAMYVKNKEENKKVCQTTLTVGKTGEVLINIFSKPK